MILQELIELLKTAESFGEINEKRGEIKSLIPVVGFMFDYDQNKSCHLYDLWEHCVRTALNIPKDNTDDMLFLAALLHDIGKLESESEGRWFEDSENHYYGHSAVSKRMVEKYIIPSLTLSKSEVLRLLYYIELHDDHMEFETTHLKKHYERVPLRTFRNLMLLQMADALAQNMEKEPIRKHYAICRELYEGKAKELYQYLQKEKEEKNKETEMFIYNLIEHMKEFGYWIDCKIYFSDKCWSDFNLGYFEKTAVLIEKREDIYVHSINKSRCNDDIVIHLLLRQGGLLYPDLRNPQLCELPYEIEKYMRTYQNIYYENSEYANSKVALFALEEFLFRHGKFITEWADDGYENDVIIISDINLESIMRRDKGYASKSKRWDVFCLS